MTWGDNPWHHKDASWGEGREQPKRHIKRATTVQTWNLAHCFPPAQNTILTQSDPELSTCLPNTPGKNRRLPPLRWRNLKEACSEWQWIFDVSTTVEAQPGADTFPLLHHFCNHTLKSETIYLLDNWKKYVASAGGKIPHQTISVWRKW